MPTTAINEIESQFAHLPPEEQLALLERLVHQMRSATVVNNHALDGAVPVEAANPRFRREWDRVSVNFGAAENDLLSEA